MDEVESILQQMTFYDPNAITVQRKDIYSNVQNKIPFSVINLARQANFEFYNRACITIPMRNGYAAAELTTKGISTASLSCGGYNFYTYQECIPLPALDNCREVLVNVVKDSYNFDFGNDFV